MLEIDPFREDALRQLMAVRYEAGDRSGALQTYEQFARRLREELGVEPMPETAALREAVIREARLPGGVGFDESSPVPGTSAHKVERLVLPFVGRETELEQLRGWWSRAARGKGGLVMLGGEAGIGKTRLAAQLGSHAEREGARILLGNTTFAEPLPYQALVGALRSALPLARRPRDRASLAGRRGLTDPRIAHPAWGRVRSPASLGAPRSRTRAEPPV